MLGRVTCVAREQEPGFTLTKALPGGSRGHGGVSGAPGADSAVNPAYSIPMVEKKFVVVLLIHGGQIDLGTVSGRLVQANATWDRRTMRTG